MRAIRRVFQVVAFVGTLMIGVLAVALIVSQTPWFRDWLRRYIVRESKQYLNGQLTIGNLDGNLLFGADLSNLAVDVSGERVVSVKGLELDYNVFTLISKGLTLQQIKIDQPVVQVERDGNGWNLARLVKRQEQEADRQGPMRPISLPSIEISDASVSIKDSITSGVTLPKRIDDVDVKARFEYEPVHYSLTLDHVSFNGRSPSLSMHDLTGKLAVRDDNLYLDEVKLRTGETSVTVNGVVEQYLSTPVVNVTTTGNLSLPEIARVLPDAAGYNLHPVFALEADGPAERLNLALNVRSEAGNVRGHLTTDVQAPDFAARGDLDVEQLNLAPILRDAGQRTNLSGHARLDLAMKSSPASVPATDRMRGTIAFNGPRVVAAGYEARNVKLWGAIAGPKITIDGRAAAYGGSATARGSLVLPDRGRALAFDLRGTADHVDLRNLPVAIGAPRLVTNLSVADYHISGEGGAIRGTAALNESMIEGATLSSGTSAEFSLGPSEISYSARGTVANLDLHRLGSALKVDALAQPAYDSCINGSFDVSGSVPRTDAARTSPANTPAMAALKLDATGTLTNSDVLGGHLPQLAFDAHLNQGGLNGRVTGGFEGFNPGQVANRDALNGTVSGTVDASVALSDVTAPITPESVTADGRIVLARSTVGGLQIDSAEVQGKYAEQVGDLAKLDVAGPDFKLSSSGRVALDRNGDSNLKYHVEAMNLPELAKLAGQGRWNLDRERGLTRHDRNAERQQPFLRFQQRARPEQPIHRHRSGADDRQCACPGGHRGDIREGGFNRAELGQGDDDLRTAGAGLHGQPEGENARARCGRSGDLPPGPPGSAFADAGGSRAGRRVADGAWQPGCGQVRGRSCGLRARAPGQRRSIPRRERYAVAGHWRVERRSQREGDQRRSASARDVDTAESRLGRQAERRSYHVRVDRRTRRDRQDSNHQRRGPELHLRFAVGQCRLQGHTHRH
jgi:hypothetical protein